MCRHLAYVGDPVFIRDIICHPPQSLVRQAWDPQRQPTGMINADGFGLGWYAENDPIPARYRSDRPIWSDHSFHDITRVIKTRALLAAVRAATPGMPYDAAANSPFAGNHFLFSHNGSLGDWPASGATLAKELSTEDIMAMETVTDSALLWALIQQRLGAGEKPSAALREVVIRAAELTPSQLNLMLTDGRSITATKWGNSLSFRRDNTGVIVASEPCDSRPGWHDVPDRSILTATPKGISLLPL